MKRNRKSRSFALKSCNLNLTFGNIVANNLKPRLQTFCFFSLQLFCCSSFLFSINENIPYGKIPNSSLLNFQISIFWFFNFRDFILLFYTSINRRNMPRLEKRCVYCSHFKSIKIKPFGIIMTSFVQYI